MEVRHWADDDCGAPPDVLRVASAFRWRTSVPVRPPHVGRTLQVKLMTHYPAPRPQQGRPTVWAPSSVRPVLLRSLYCGEIVWNQSQKRDRLGQSGRSARSDEAWVSVAAPALRIISDELWTAAQRERERRESRYAAGERSHRESRYLLSGLARCAQCGGGFASHQRSHGSPGKRTLPVLRLLRTGNAGRRSAPTTFVGRMDSHPSRACTGRATRHTVCLPPF